MPTYTQAGRPVRARTALGPDVLLLQTFSGVEAVSRPFQFTLELLSERSHIDPEELLRKPAVIAVDLPDGGERFFHGIISRFVQLDRKEGLTSYRAEVVPWLWFLSLSQDCRIFQEKSVVEIVEEVFKDLGYDDFRFKTVRDYPTREYCVQYRETHLAFVSRLMEEEGMYYFFEHTDDGHTLVITDTNTAMVPCVGAENASMARQTLQDEDVVLALWREHSVHAGRVTLNDYDYLQPSLGLEAWTKGHGTEEAYDYPGKYTTRDEGERYTRLRMEAIESLHHTVNGTSTCRGFQSGGRFHLKDHYRKDANQEYALLQVQHYASVGGYRTAFGGGNATEYRNEFVAIPYKVTYRPAAATEKPVVRGAQTALVVGPSGEEVYVDRHGRIKVQFHWDRYGQKNENSSCWIRVASPWAGDGWGAVHIPRIDNEVLVEFIEGDPDRPIVVASVYNADQTPPFPLPGARLQSGVKSRSSKGGGGHNEITLTDSKGEEQIHIHAQHDMVTTVLHDQTRQIRNNRTTTVDVDDTETVGGNQSMAVGGNRNASIGADDTTEVGSNLKMTAGSNVELHAGTDVEIHAGASGTLTAGSSLSIEGGASVSVDGPTVTISGATTIKLESGASSITMTPGSIALSSPMITISGDGMVTVSGGLVKIN